MNRSALATLALLVTPPLAPAGELLASSTHAHRGTATVDGFNEPLEWEGAEFGEVTLTLPAALGGGTTLITFLVMNDDDYLYAALQFPYSSSPAWPAFLDFAVQFWADGTSACNPTVPVDVVQLVSQSNAVDFRDEHWPMCTTVSSDVSAGGTIDGTGVWEDEGATIFFELSHALDSDDNLHDVSAVTPGFVQVKPFAYGCDAAATCGNVANLTRRVFLVPESYLFFSDFESGDVLDWSIAVP